MPEAVWHLAVTVEGAAAAAAAAALLDGCAAALSLFETAEDSDVWRLDAYPPQRCLDAELRLRLALAAAAAGGRLVALDEERVPARDWLAETRRAFPALRIGRFLVHGSHLRPPRDGAIRLEIDAASAFGTGEHPSTQGCLLALDRLARRRRFRRPCDIGCGSGILAIAAARLLRRGPGLRPGLRQHPGAAAGADGARPRTGSGARRGRGIVGAAAAPGADRAGAAPGAARAARPAHRHRRLVDAGPAEGLQRRQPAVTGGEPRLARVEHRAARLALALAAGLVEAFDDRRDFRAAQADIGERAIVERAQLGIGALAAAPLGKGLAGPDQPIDGEHDALLTVWCSATCRRLVDKTLLRRMQFS